MKNIHGEKKLKCSKCNQKFGLEFQLKYHEKYCGQQLTCATCRKCYDKPTSLWMHCKRLGHCLPDNNNDQNFKFRKSISEQPPPSSSEFTKCSNVILVPMLTTTTIPETCDISNNHNSDSNMMKIPYKNDGNKFILPKNSVDNSKQNQSSMNNNVHNNNKCAKNESNTKPKLKRSTECQTIRKRHRRTSRPIESNSIQTQTMHSSFDLPSVMINHRDYTNNDNDNNDCQQKIFPLNFESNRTNIVKNCSKTSTFTQTLFDDEIESDINTSIIQHHDDPFMIKSMMIEDDDDDRQQATDVNTNNDNDVVETNNDHHRSLYQNIETQTKEDDDCSWDHHHDDLRFNELFEFVDIETQTIWNYDQTTQTDHHHHHHSDDWSDFLNS